MCVHFINDVWHCGVLHIYCCNTVCVLTPLIFGPDVLFATCLMDGMPPIISQKFHLCFCDSRSVLFLSRPRFMATQLR